MRNGSPERQHTQVWEEKVQPRRQKFQRHEYWRAKLQALLPAECKERARLMVANPTIITRLFALGLARVRGTPHGDPADSDGLLLAGSLHDCRVSLIEFMRQSLGHRAGETRNRHAWLNPLLHPSSQLHC